MPKVKEYVSTTNVLPSTVGKIYTPIFSFFRKRIVNITISDLRPVSNKRPVNFTYRGVHEFLNLSIFEKITVFEIYAVVFISQKILCVKWLFSKLWGF